MTLLCPSANGHFESMHRPRSTAYECGRTRPGPDGRTRRRAAQSRRDIEQRRAPNRSELRTKPRNGSVPPHLFGLPDLVGDGLEDGSTNCRRVIGASSRGTAPGGGYELLIRLVDKENMLPTKRNAGMLSISPIRQYIVRSSQGTLPANCRAWCYPVKVSVASALTAASRGIVDPYGDSAIAK
jgi:hypothetical protein